MKFFSIPILSLRIKCWFLTQECKKTERSIFPLLCVFVLKKIALSTSWEMLKWYLKRFFALLKWGFSKLFSFTNSVATKLRKLFFPWIFYQVLIMKDIQTLHVGVSENSHPLGHAPFPKNPKKHGSSKSYKKWKMIIFGIF